MAASSPNGEMQFWFQGLPYAGVQNGTKDFGEMQYWSKGLPGGWLFPATTAVLPIRMLMGMGT